ncbi:hypothetical protein K3177_13760 [Qipengyuania sp. GH25]|uniref:DUF4232 domain-containing protein n=1 Tax=Qipengyuania pacifica TaxID=2860199 RepID=A0ABS7JHT1_9SPHN|nr:hypothetical protein [Qipengyuania aerophila]MBX7489583.1 hypothetical protein [Qipengyuania aerophila]
MSNSDRGKRSEAWLGIALALAAIVGGVIFWDASKNEAISQVEAEDRARDYADSAREDIAPTCIALKLSAADCADKAEDRYRPEQRQEYDLAAQRTMSAWTRAMGLAALVGMAVGIFGLGLIWRTWDATREAANSSAKTLLAFIAKERGILEQRDGFRTTSLVDLSEGISVEFENIGSAPCTLTKVQWSFTKTPEWPENFNHSLKTKRVIPPVKKCGTPCLAFDIRPEAGRPIYLIGTAKYETLDCEGFETHFGLIVSYQPDDGYGPERWQAVRIFIRNRPFDT